MRTLLLILLLIPTVLTAQIPIDKKLHAGMGSAIAGIGSTFHMPQYEIVTPAIKGLTGAAILGTSKELFDLLVGGTPEWADIGYTMLGAITVTGIIIVVKVIIRRYG